MTPLLTVVAAEWQRLRGRPVARLQAVASPVLVALLLALAALLRLSVTTGDGTPVFADTAGADATGWLVVLRTLPIGLGLAGLVGVGLSAGDLDTGTIRDDLCRPVRRGDVVLARWIAAAAWAGAVHAVTFGVAAAGSTLIFGAGGDWGAAVGTALGAWGGEVVALALGIGAGFTAGSALGAVSLLFVGATADTAAWLATRALALGMAVTVQLGGAPVDDRLPNALAALLPHAALLAWRSDAVPAAAAVVGWTAVGLALGMWRLSRRDV